MESEWDVVIVGGGPAGATAAGYLARLGHRVLVLEKERFPRRRVGESLLPSMMPVLVDFGLIEEVERHGFPVKTGGTFVWGRSREPWDVYFKNNPFLPHTYAYHVDRAVFDRILLDHAAARGAEVIHGAKVEAPIVEGGRVRGVEWIDEAGRRTRSSARWTIDASGPAAVLARSLTRRSYDEKMRQVAFYSYFRSVTGPKGERAGHVLIESNPWGWFWYIPQNGKELGEASVGLVSGQEFKDEYKALGVEGFFQRALAQSPLMLELLGPHAERIAPYEAIVDWSYTSDRMAGPGFFLAGDAAAFLDPLLSTGCSIAMLAGYTSSVAIHTMLAGEVPESDALGFFDTNYQRMWKVTQDFLHYFYAGNASAHKDDFFWKARKTMNFSDNVGAAQSFCFLVNTIPANPHPALRRQIHMYMQFMANIEHPEAALREVPEFKSRAAEEGRVRETDTLTDSVWLRLNGELEESWTIDGPVHKLRPVRGLSYDQSRPVFSSTSSWLLGKNIHPLEGDGLRLAECIGSGASWPEVRDRFGVGAEAAVEALRAERLILLQLPDDSAGSHT